MTPIEKAKELVDRFYTIDSDSEMFDGFTMPIFYAERCALIAVDEIIDISYWAFMELGGKQKQEFWQEVKQEIEKL